MIKFLTANDRSCATWYKSGTAAATGEIFPRRRSKLLRLWTALIRQLWCVSRAIHLLSIDPAAETDFMVSINTDSGRQTVHFLSRLRRLGLTVECSSVLCTAKRIYPLHKTKSSSSSSSSSYLFPVRTNRNIVYIDNLTKKNRTGGYQRSWTLIKLAAYVNHDNENKYSKHTDINKRTIRKRQGCRCIKCEP